MKVEKASGSELGAFNPIFANPSITQMVILSNPERELVELSYRLSYSINGEEYVESGVIERGIPSTID